MEFVNIIDEKKRFLGLRVIFGEPRQRNSHEWSYLGLREDFKKEGMKMGFDKLIERPCPSCKNETDFDFYGIQQGISEIPFYPLYSCRICQSTFSSESLDL